MAHKGVGCMKDSMVMTIGNAARSSGDTGSDPSHDVSTVRFAWSR